MDWNRFNQFVRKSLRERFDACSRKLGLPGKVEVTPSPHFTKNPESMGFKVKVGDREGLVSTKWFCDTQRGDRHRMATLPEGTYKDGDYISERYEGFLIDLFGEEARASSREKDKLHEVMERAGVDLGEISKPGSQAGENISVN